MQHTDYSKLKQQAKQASGSIAEQIETTVKGAVGDIKADDAEIREAIPFEPRPVDKPDGPVEEVSSGDVVQHGDIEANSSDSEADSEQEQAVSAKPVVIDPMIGNDYDIFTDGAAASDAEGFDAAGTGIKKVHPGEYREHVQRETPAQERYEPTDDVLDEDRDEQPEEPEPKPDARSKPKYRQVPRGADGNIVTSTVKNIPTDLLNYVKSQFRYAAPNNTIAVAACLYAAVGFPQNVDVSDEIKQYASDFISDAVVIEDVKDLMQSRFNKLDMTFRDLLRNVNDLKVAAVYAIFDKLGFTSGDKALTPGEVDFLEMGTGDLRRQLEKQSHGQWEREIQSKGRPLK